MDRKYPGLMERGDSVQITFTYQGQRIRESIRLGRKPTKSIFAELNRKREAILYSIDMGTFDYSEHFPNSARAIKYSSNKGSLITVKQALNTWLIDAESRCEYSTIRGYTSAIRHHLDDSFGHLKLSELRLQHVKDWISTLTISKKRINNVLSPLRQVFADAYEEGDIIKNPLERFKSLPITTREPKPFSPTEIKKILEKLNGQEKNLIQFAFWSGLRSSELIALRWEDVDFDRNRFFVRHAIVYQREKSTKTKSGKRTVDLQSEALKALKDQTSYSKNADRVFLDPKNDKRWHSDQPIRKRIWIPALKKAGVEYRNPYQTRHTYASTMLSTGKNPMWVAQQMGHKDTSMIFRVYGKWISQD